jgi:drug/metabolite transporter (DMT)-like permease
MTAPASNVIDMLVKLLPLIIPLLLLQLILMVVALVDLVRREKTRGPKWLWAIIIVLGEVLGPILYLLIGREE